MIAADRIARKGFLLFVLLFALQLALLIAEQEVPWVLDLGVDVAFWSIFTPLIYDWSRSRTASEDRALFLLELADFLRLGVPVNEALEKLVKMRARAYGHRFASLSRTLAEVSRRVAGGEQLPAAFQAVKGIPPHWASYTQYCEEPKRLAELLEELAEVERSRLRLPFLSALRMQIMVPLVLGSGIFLSTYIMPTFVELFTGLDLALPLSTRIFLGTIDVARTLHIGFFVTIFFLLVFLAIPFVGVRRFLLRLFSFTPGVRHLAKLDCQRQVYRLLGTGLQFGVPLAGCLREAQKAVYLSGYRNFLEVAEADTSTELSSMFLKAPGLFSPNLSWLVKQGESLENLPEALSTAASLADSELEQLSIKLATNLDTLVLVTVGVFVGFTAVSVMVPLYQLIGQLG